MISLHLIKPAQNIPGYREDVRKIDRGKKLIKVLFLLFKLQSLAFKNDFSELTYDGLRSRIHHPPRLSAYAPMSPGLQNASLSEAL